MEEKEKKEELQQEQVEEVEEDEVEAEDTTDENEVDSEEGIKKLEGEIKGLEEELASAKEEKEKYLQRVKRLKADFSNYKKRMTKEKEKIVSNANQELLLDLLPVIDNFERALASSKNSDDSSDVLQGVEMIYKQLFKVLTTNGVEEIEAVGEEFDPNYHEAVGKVESEEYDSGIVAEEMQKGYLFNGVLLRPAMVRVAQ
ncbi:nucleotide exchange factor GrpE [Natroniella sulfidigena]|uniref:nucleotide exchange factor GrpE n=1 Tax=Natroniella sulfidigena TaxID=723921 RepID=UPI00200A546C|nr:nucleotide exchange factor GrpE [Natroniella sulfidigena]MCK8815917.1 nucleotide exchange factor GrpE [Natroniella sulfidigena]